MYSKNESKKHIRHSPDMKIGLGLAIFSPETVLNKYNVTPKRDRRNVTVAVTVV